VILSRPLIELRRNDACTVTCSQIAIWRSSCCASALFHTCESIMESSEYLQASGQIASLRFEALHCLADKFGFYFRPKSVKPRLGKPKGIIHSFIFRRDDFDGRVCTFIPNRDPRVIDFDRMRGTILKANNRLPANGNFKLVTPRLDENRKGFFAFVSNWKSHASTWHRLVERPSKPAWQGLQGRR
jgi:hypothetical protein